MKLTKLLVTLVCAMTLLMSCERESVTPSTTPTNNTLVVTGKWFNYNTNVYAQTDTTVISQNGNQFVITELDYVIYYPIAMTYDVNTNLITISGNQQQYTVEGTGYFIGDSIMHLDYTVTPGMTTEMHSNWRK